MMNRIVRKSLLGVTLTELLAVLVIVAILATLAVPATTRRLHQSRVATARAETEALAKAEDAVGLTHGFYIPLQVLDNLAIDQTTRDNETDDLQNEFGQNVFLIDLSVNPQTQLSGSQERLESNPSNPRVREMVNNWAGPFINFHRYFIGEDFGSGSSPTDQLSQTQVARDFPLDPWGYPYRLYSPLGITGSTLGTSGPITDITAIDTSSFSNGLLTNVDDRFDRFAVVSFGPDGESDRTTTSGGVSGLPILGDDIIYEFGALIPQNETNVTGIVP
jgi:prepilin-type N-terminal cleavage/methylation domain-containing protein